MANEIIRLTNGVKWSKDSVVHQEITGVSAAIDVTNVLASYTNISEYVTAPADCYAVCSYTGTGTTGCRMRVDGRDIGPYHDSTNSTAPADLKYFWFYLQQGQTIGVTSGVATSIILYGIK